MIGLGHSEHRKDGGSTPLLATSSPPREGSVLGTTRASVDQRSLPIATRERWIIMSDLGDRDALMVAAAMVLDEILNPERFV